ncbi:MAG: alpha/beta hydrolase [Candidatus Limnocylindrales bacterium]
MSQVGTVVARDGLTLRTRDWPAVGASWARLLLVHGIAEHSGRYERTGSLLAAGGVDVAAFDLRGFGASEGRRALVRRWDDYLDDVQDRLAALPRDLPRVLMGHSMGGLIALTYVTGGRPAPDLLVLSSPALGASVPAPMRAAAPWLARIAPTLRLGNRLRPDQLSRDPAVGEAYFADPLVYPSTTTRLAAEMFGAIDGARRDAAALHIPTLVTHGAADTIVPPASSEILGGLPGVERRPYPGLRHETLNEPEGPQVVADILAWLRAHLPTG